jgi:hypothetical protein
MGAMNHQPLTLAVRAQPPAIPVFPGFMASGPPEFRAAQEAPLAHAGGAKADLGALVRRGREFVNNPAMAIGIYMAFPVGAPECRRQTYAVIPMADASAHEMLERILRRRDQRPPQSARIRQQPLPKFEERTAARDVDQFSALCKKTIAGNGSIRCEHGRCSSEKKSTCCSARPLTHLIKSANSFTSCVEFLWRPP